MKLQPVLSAKSVSSMVVFRLIVLLIRSLATERIIHNLFGWKRQRQRQRQRQFPPRQLLLSYAIRIFAWFISEFWNIDLIKSGFAFKFMS